MKWGSRIKLATRRPIRIMLLMGISCCCLTMLAIHTLYSPSVSTSRKGDMEEWLMPPEVALDEEEESIRLSLVQKLIRQSRMNREGDSNLSFAHNRHGNNIEALNEFDNLNGSNFVLGRRRMNEKKENVLLKELSVQATASSNNWEAIESRRDMRVNSVANLTHKRVRRRRASFTRTLMEIKPVWNKHLYYNHSSIPEKFKEWDETREVFCEGKMDAYAHQFAKLQKVVIDREFCTCKLKGGEYIHNVLLQSEENEYYTFDMGCFRMECDERPKYSFDDGNNHINNWIYSLATHTMPDGVLDVRSPFTIAITRYEYANLYHTMTDWYNAFALMQFFNQTSYTTNILIIDAHPYGQLDSVWSQLFNSTIRLSRLPKLTYFPTLVWGVIGYNSPMTTYLSPRPPLYEEFREFFMKSYSLDPSAHILDCEHINILFIWRHDYVAHPRNPAGFVSRKIANEAQLLHYVTKRNPAYRVAGMQIDMLDMNDQLKQLANTDILIGMHGAGLTHTLFLPQKAALIELVPSYWSAMSEHFLAITEWRGLVYSTWVNNDPLLEGPNDTTTIPPYIMNTLLKKAVKRLCSPRNNVTDKEENSDHETTEQQDQLLEQEMHYMKEEAVEQARLKQESADELTSASTESTTTKTTLSTTTKTTTRSTTTAEPTTRPTIVKKRLQSNEKSSKLTFKMKSKFSTTTLSPEVIYSANSTKRRRRRKETMHPDT